MNIYSLIKLNSLIKSPTLKGIGIWMLHILNKRYQVLFFDPILGCNLQCRMCYFSNEEKRKQLKGQFNESDLDRIAKVIFPQALKLQIGCGAEPSLYKHNTKIIRLAKQYGVPHISFTTNANLLSTDMVYALLEAGLDEFIISLHGIEKDTYEHLMKNASYDKFMGVLRIISEAKKAYPNFKLRINYTVNELNIEELTHFFQTLEGINIDILQVRPIQDIGGEIKTNKDQEAFNSIFNKITLQLKEECNKRGITYIAPMELNNEATVNKRSSVVESTYFYISPRSFWREDMDWRNETFREYSKRTHYAGTLFREIFSQKKYTDRRLNYNINN